MNQRFTIRILKLIFLISSLSFLVIQIQLRRQQNSGSKLGSGVSIHGPFVGPIDEVPIPPVVTPTAPQALWNISAAGKSARVEEPKVLRPGLDDIRKSIEFNNANAEVFNEEKFGPLSEVETVVVIQV